MNEIEIEHPDNEEEDQGNGQGNNTGYTQQPIPKARVKMKDKGKGKTMSTWKKMKSHKELAIYTLANDDIDMVDYQVRDATEEVVQQKL